MNRISFYTRETTAADYLQMRAPRELWAAVLKQAIEDALNGPSQMECKHMTLEQSREYRLAVQLAAGEWMDDEENEPRRFVWLCEQLGLNPAAVRGEVARRAA